MKDLKTIPWPRLPNKVSTPLGPVSYEAVFRILSPHTEDSMLIICSTKHGWDHVSVSLATRCPTWQELDWIKRVLFEPNEVAMQLHVPTADHINIHPYVLHLWRPHNVQIPLPPKELV